MACLRKKITKHLKSYNEKFIPQLVDNDGDDSYKVDLDMYGIELKEYNLYEFLNVHFSILYNKEGTEQYVG